MYNSQIDFYKFIYGRLILLKAPRLGFFNENDIQTPIFIIHSNAQFSKIVLVFYWLIGLFIIELNLKPRLGFLKNAFPNLRY